MNELVRTGEVARLTGASVKMINRWCNRREVRALRAGKLWLFAPEHIDRIRELQAALQRKQHTQQEATPPQRQKDQSRERLVLAIERIADALESWVTRPSA